VNRVEEGGDVRGRVQGVQGGARASKRTQSRPTLGQNERRDLRAVPGGAVGAQEVVARENGVGS